MGEGVSVLVGVDVGVRVGVGVLVAVGVDVGVLVAVAVGEAVGVMVAVSVGAGVTVVVTNTLDGSGRLTAEKFEKPLTVLFSNRLPFERQSWGYIYCQSGFAVSLSKGMNAEKLQG